MVGRIRGGNSSTGNRGCARSARCAGRCRPRDAANTAAQAAKANKRKVEANLYSRTPPDIAAARTSPVDEPSSPMPEVTPAPHWPRPRPRHAPAPAQRRSPRRARTRANRTSPSKAWSSPARAGSMTVVHGNQARSCTASEIDAERGTGTKSSWPSAARAPRLTRACRRVGRRAVRWAVPAPTSSLRRSRVCCRRRREGRDKFEQFEQNSVKRPAIEGEQVSTFSADVDTASYSFVRKQLNQGVLPQKDCGARRGDDQLLRLLRGRRRNRASGPSSPRWW